MEQNWPSVGPRPREQRWILARRVGLPRLGAVSMNGPESEGA